MSSKLKIVSFALVMGLAVYAVAQEKAGQTKTDKNRTGQDQAGQERAGQQPAGQARTGGAQMDAHIAACLILGNQKEVALGTFAAEQAKNEKVKAFANQMVQVHSKAVADLKRFVAKEISLNDVTVDASPRTATGGQQGQARKPDQYTTDPTRRPATTGQGKTTTPADDNRDRTFPTSVNTRESGSDLDDQQLAIAQEIVKKCLQLTKVELQKHGEAFDQAYLGDQVAAHIGMIAAMEVYEKHASPELQRLIQQSHSAAQQHLQHADQLIKEIRSPARESREENKR